MFLPDSIIDRISGGRTSDAVGKWGGASRRDARRDNMKMRFRENVENMKEYYYVCIYNILGMREFDLIVFVGGILII